MEISGCSMFCSIQLILCKTGYTTFRSKCDTGIVVQLLIVVEKDTFKENNFLKSVQPSTANSNQFGIHMTRKNPCDCRIFFSYKIA